MSARAQLIILWWAFIFMVIFALAWTFLLHMVPLPPATLTVAEVVDFYTQNASDIKLGAAIASWTSAFWVPFTVVVAVQMARLERGRIPVWSILALVGGVLSSMFIVFPPIMWGVIAFNPGRDPNSTALLNEMANLTLTTTDQFFIFQMIAMTYVSFTQKNVPHSPFPRWYGWFNFWIAIIFEVGAMAFLFKTGPFAWNGLFVYWFPFCGFFIWLTTTMYLMRSKIKLQLIDEMLLEKA